MPLIGYGLAAAFITGFMEVLSGSGPKRYYNLEGFLTSFDPRISFILSAATNAGVTVLTGIPCEIPRPDIQLIHISRANMVDQASGSLHPRTGFYSKIFNRNCNNVNASAFLYKLYISLTGLL